MQLTKLCLYQVMREWTINKVIREWTNAVLKFSPYRSKLVVQEAAYISLSPATDMFIVAEGG